MNASLGFIAWKDKRRLLKRKKKEEGLPQKGRI
jgi:hypothetical protein